MAISEFKAKCLAVIERIRKTGQPLVITKRGVPVAQVLPPPLPKSNEQSAFGCMKGTVRELGDIIEPLPEEDWEVLR